MTVALATVAGAPAVAQEPADPGPSGNIGIRLLEAPVSLQDDPRALAYIIDNLPPGTTITRRIEVSNSSSLEEQVSIYPAAANIDNNDGFQIGDGRAVNELTTWMSVTPTDVTLAPNSVAEAVVTIAVPSDAPEGEQYAVVWAETAGPSNGTGIQNVSRAGIRTYLSVGAGNGPAADLEIGDVVASRNESGTPQVVANITNTGGRALDPSGTVELSGGPGGISTAPVKGSSGSIAPGQSGSVTFTLDPALPAGPWQAAVTITSGLVSKTSAVELTFPDQGSVTAAGTSSDSGVPVWIWGLAALVAVAIAVAVVVVMRRRKIS